MIRIKGWASFQSYKDRKPPWIRLHKTLLDNFKFHKMSVDARALLPMLWLLASEDEDPVSGLIRIRNDEITFRLRMDLESFEKTIAEILAVKDNDGGQEFIEIVQPIENKPCNDSVTDSSRNGHAGVTPETETETETETERGPRSPEANPDVCPPISNLTSLQLHPLDGAYERWRQKFAPNVSLHDTRDALALKCQAEGRKYTDYGAELRGWAGARQQNHNKNNPKALPAKTQEENAKMLERFADV